MNELSKGTKIFMAAITLAVTLLIPSVGYVFGSITELKVEQAITKTKQTSISEDVKEIKEDVNDIRELFLGPKPSTE